MENPEKISTKKSTSIFAFLALRKKKFIKISIITALTMAFISSCTTNFILTYTTQRIFTRTQIEALQYEFEFILPDEARIVHFERWRVPREQTTITVSIAGIKDLDSFLEHNLLFELTTPGGDMRRDSRYLRRRVDAIVYGAAQGPRIEARGQFDEEDLSWRRHLRRSVWVLSIDDNETAIVKITQHSSIESSPYRQIFGRMIAVNAPFQLYKMLLGLD